jgi:hypothetical protein
VICADGGRGTQDGIDTRPLLSANSMCTILLIMGSMIPFAWGVSSRGSVMKIAPFGVEIWMNDYETRCRYFLAETCTE